MNANRASTLVIVGAGGHGRVVADAALAAGTWDNLLATDSNPSLWSGELLPGVRLLPEDEAMSLRAAVFHLAIGSAAMRERQAHKLEGRLASVVHPRASVSPYAHLGTGSFVAAQAVVAPRAELGACVIVNHGAVVDHDCVLGACSHVAPCASLGGGVSIGARVLVGAGARILPGARVADDVVIGAGAVVLRSITQAGTFAGVPARRVR